MAANDNDGGSTLFASRFAAICMIAFAGAAGGALAGDNPLLGTWKLKSFARQDVATGESRPALGEHPEGFLGYASDGRMYALFVAGGRAIPAADQPTDDSDHDGQRHFYTRIPLNYRYLR
jgi:hypothetical protein